MANLSELNGIIDEMFTVLSTLIGNVVDLLTGDLITLALVGSLITLLVGFFYVVFKYIRNMMENSITGKNVKK